MIHLVQISNGSSRRVAMVEEPHLHCLTGVQSVYELAQRCLSLGRQLSEQATALANGELLDYDAIYSGASEWHLLAPIDVPGASSRLMIAGTGLTHLGSAKERQAMHLAHASKAAETLTDSMRMFQWGIEGGRPAEGEIGIAPEWFYKGNGSMLRAPFAPLTIPAYAEDGGEEAELAGIYLIGDDGTPYRIGMAAGNEFSDHQFEKLEPDDLVDKRRYAAAEGEQKLCISQCQKAFRVRFNPHGEGPDFVPAGHPSYENAAQR